MNACKNIQIFGGRSNAFISKHGVLETAPDSRSIESPGVAYEYRTFVTVKNLAAGSTAAAPMSKMLTPPVPITVALLCASETISAVFWSMPGGEEVGSRQAKKKRKIKRGHWQ
jgi:hypothetical protein